MRPHRHISMKVGRRHLPSQWKSLKLQPPVAKPVSAEAVVGEEGTLPPGPVAAQAEGVEARVLNETAAVAQESAVPETASRATTPEV
jgi:hypothetical protein